MSLGFGKSDSSSSQQSSSKPLSPEELTAYFNQLNTSTGGRLQDFATAGTAPTTYTGLTPDQIAAAGYRAPSGVETASYGALTPDQIKALGGMGATRTADVNRARAAAVNQITADPNLTIAQRQRSTQLNNQDAQDRLDAINKETEAAITGLSSQEAQRTYDATTAAANTRNAFASEQASRGYTSDQAALAANRAEALSKYQAGVANAGLTKEDLQMLANIYFGGKGQVSSGAGGSTSSSFDIGGGVGK